MAGPAKLDLPNHCLDTSCAREMSTTSRIVPDILISGGSSMLAGAVYDLVFSYVDRESFTLICFCKEVKVCLKLF